MDIIYRRFRLNVPGTARFLVPQPHKKQDQLSYKFSINRLESDVGYTALSYVWGAPVQRRPGNSRPEHVLLEGVPFPVTQNLLSALTMVEGTMALDSDGVFEPPLIWADQLCINQDDDAEKSVQVAQMGELYSKSHKVYICLGGSSGDAQDAIRLISEVSQRLDTEKAHYGGVKSIPAAHNCGPDWEWYNRFNWDALRTLLRQPWFSRVWVVQEAGLATHAVALYGGHSFEWHSLMLILSWLSEGGNRLRLNYEVSGWTTHQLWVSFNHDARDELDNNRHYNFLDLISHAAYQFNASNPRDYIYAFLGHPSSRSAGVLHRTRLMEPDYTASCRDVFLQFAYLWLEDSHQPHILSCVNHESLPKAIQQVDIPSWCPRWDYIPLGGGRLVDESYGKSFHAAKSTRLKFQPLPGDCLELRGFTCDVVTKTFHCLNDLISDLYGGRLEDLAPSIRNMASYTGLAILCHRVLDRTEDPFSSISSFATTSIAAPLDSDRDQTLGNFIPIVGEAQRFSCNTWLKAAADYKKALNELADLCQQFHPKSPDQDSAAIMNTIKNLLLNRRLFLGASGRLGLGPKVVEAGDHVCIITGGQVPYVLRPLDGTRFLFVGESYVDGIMNGEAIGDNKTSNANWCNFELV